MIAKQHRVSCVVKRCHPRWKLEIEAAELDFDSRCRFPNKLALRSRRAEHSSFGAVCHLFKRLKKKSARLSGHMESMKGE